MQCEKWKQRLPRRVFIQDSSMQKQIMEEKSIFRAVLCCNMRPVCSGCELCSKMRSSAPPGRKKQHFLTLICLCDVFIHRMHGSSLAFIPKPTAAQTLL